MATPLSLHHHKPPFLSSQKPLLTNTASSFTTSSAVATTTTTTTNPNQTQPCLVLLEKCSNMSHLKQIQAQMIRNGLFSDEYYAAKIVAFCALQDSGSLQYAVLVFTQIPNPTTYTYNSIIRGYTNKNSPQKAILFYQQMVFQGLFPDRFTFPSLFKSCHNLYEGKQLHCHSIKFGFGQDLYIQNTLMNMYSDCGCFVSAQKVFDKMSERSVVSWATMIGAYAQWGRPVEALELFERMGIENVKPNAIALINVLNVCASVRELNTAKRVHQYIDENGIGFHIVLYAALMDAYCKCGCLSLARGLFDTMPEKNLYCWNIVIRGHVEDGDHEAALLLFRKMQLKGLKGDKVTMVSVLLACTHLGALDLGKWLHLYIRKERIEKDVALGTALVDMYVKCGDIESALGVFHEMPEKDVMTWTALILGLSMCGQGEKALEYFRDMKMRGVKPDSLTLLGVLTACSHAGLVDEGLEHFSSMSNRYGIEPSVEHYDCVIDMFGRAGCVAKAEKLIQNMTMPPNEYVSRRLPSGYRMHNNLEGVEKPARQFLQINPENGGTYKRLSNMYKGIHGGGKHQKDQRL